MNRIRRINACLNKVNPNVQLKRWVKRIILAIGVSATAAAFAIEVLDGAWHTSWVWKFYFWRRAHTSVTNESPWLVCGFAALSVALMATFTAYGLHKRRLAARRDSGR